MKLSIITINYNNCEGLRKTIESVVNQTWQDFEWIIVDGGSTDGSRELIEETAAHLAAQDWRTEQFSLLGFTAEGWESGDTLVPSSREARSRTLLWASEKDNGIYNAMNKGIVMAQGEYCLFLNSGDWLYDNDVLQNVFSYGLVEDIVYGDSVVLSPIQQYWSVPKTKINRKWFYRNSIHHGAAFIKKYLFIQYGFYDEQLKIVSDWKFFLQSIVMGNTSFEHVPITIYCFEGGGISDQVAERRKENAVVMRELFIDLIEEDYAYRESVNIIRKYTIFRIIYAVMYRASSFFEKLKK